MSSLEPKAHLRFVTERAHRLLGNDLKAINAELHAQSPGGCARTAVNIVAECGAINGFVADFLTTGNTERPSSEERDAFIASFDTADKALAFLDESTAKLLAAIDAEDEAALGTTNDLFFGRPMSRFAIAELPSTHMMYHDGQLNYIQTLHGDSEMHWG